MAGTLIADTIQHSDATSTATNVLAATNAAQSFTAQQTFAELKETTYSLTGTDIDPANGSIQSKTVAANTTLPNRLKPVRLLCCCSTLERAIQSPGQR